mgnify:CR=1 FL=1
MTPARNSVSEMQAGSAVIRCSFWLAILHLLRRQTGFADALAKVKLRIHLSLYQDTKPPALCHWHIRSALPEAGATLAPTTGR